MNRDRSRLWMLESIDRARRQHGLHLWAYVLMPEHVHLLIWPTRVAYSISAILKSLKQSVSRRAIAFVKRNAPGFLQRLEDRQPNGRLSHRFWQRGGGFDSNLTETQTIRRTIECIHANPVRRGLCVSPFDWCWSSAIEMERPGTGLLQLNLESLPQTDAG
ncbi:MAG: transposase [Planctomycetaceae bacterium]|nr:transposase [Planctomycetaceae bacterium]